MKNEKKAGFFDILYASKFLMISLILCFVLIIVCSIWFGIEQWEKNNAYITLDEFDKIEIGMSYDDVVALAGVKGTIISSDGTTALYQWGGYSAISYAYITFSNDCVSDKYQVYLR